VIAAKILRKQSKAAHGIVPPIVEVDDGAARVLEGTGNCPQQNRLVVSAPNERVQAKDAVEGALKRWSEIVRPNEDNIVDTPSAGPTPSIVQIGDGQITMKDEAKLPSISKRVITSTGCDVAEY
jgi:hypothetical protein